ncbi:MAG: hypothetical protein OXI81_06360 [Paracoccaceae bacterium]|nr:hypothetical protein [Paracoccaceae bacterium]
MLVLTQYLAYADICDRLVTESCVTIAGPHYEGISFKPIYGWQASTN